MQNLAEDVRAQLAPHCERCEIAGSVRRKCSEPGDIEIVAIPKPYEVGFLESGIALVLEEMEVVKGVLPCKYTQRILPGSGVKLDFFTATRDNWGNIFLMRTGPWEFSKKFLGTWLPKKGYKSDGGILYHDGLTVAVPEEIDMFRLAEINYIEPECRL